MKSDKTFQYQRQGSARLSGQMLAALVEAGYSNTRARRAVLAALCDAAGPASPAELLVLGHAHHPTLGLVTVYRTLDVLVSLGLVRRLHRDEGCHTYVVNLCGRQPPASGEAESPFFHLVCERCGRAVEWEGRNMAEIVMQVEAQTGFVVRDPWVQVLGLCPRCQDSPARAAMQQSGEESEHA